MTVQKMLGNGDLSHRSDAQLAHRLEQQFDAIWRIGDRDECSIKHIGHAMAALIVTGDWRKAVDYAEPWDYYPHGETVELEMRRKRLAEKWGKVIDTVDRIDNLERVVERVLPQVKHSYYILAYLEDYRYELEDRA